MAINTIEKVAGMALVVAAVLNITRVAPIFLSDGVSMQNFPPTSVDDLVVYTDLFGWSVSHMMGILSVPLIVFGFIVLWRSAGRSVTSLVAMVGFSTGMGLYLFALVTDGLVLPRIIEHLEPALQSNSDASHSLVWLTHAFATSFAGFGTLVLLTSTAFLGLSILNDFKRPMLGYVGIALGSLSLIGFLIGYLDIISTDGLGRVGPLSLLMFVYVIFTGVLLLKSDESARSE